MYTHLMEETYKITGRVWIYPGDAAWHFVNVDKDNSVTIKKFHGTPRRGFGSIPVRVTLGGSTWNTSIFPDSASDEYLLPLKKSVRTAESIKAGDTVTFTLDIARP